MAELTGILSPGDIDTVFSRTAIQVGTRIKDTRGNEYIFMRGVASTIKGSWVTYDELYDTTLLAANLKGPVAVAMAAIVANRWGWYCIFGSVLAAMALSSADNAIVGYETTSGYAGDGRAAGDLIYRAISRSAEEGTAAQAQYNFQIWYPFVDDLEAAH